MKRELNKRIPFHPLLGVVRVLLVASAVAWLVSPVKVLTVQHEETGKTYIIKPVRDGETVQLSWVHSVEKTPWVEIYVVDENVLALREIRVQSFGAGVDAEVPVVAVNDGWIVMREMKRSFPELRFFYSNHVNHQLEVNGCELPMDDILPHHVPVVVKVLLKPRLQVFFSEVNDCATDLAIR